MQALAERAKAGKVDNVKVYYMHSEERMKNSLLQYELMGRIKPYCMFMQATERALIKKGVEDGNRKVVYFVPNSFSQSIRFFYRRSLTCRSKSAHATCIWSLAAAHIRSGSHR